MELLVLNPGKSQTNWDELAPPVLALTQFYSLLSLLGQLHVVHSACPSPHLPRQLQSIYLMDVMKCVTVTSTPACPRRLSPPPTAARPHTHSSGCVLRCCSCNPLTQTATREESQSALLPHPHLSRLQVLPICRYSIMREQRRSSWRHLCLLVASACDDHSKKSDSVYGTALSSTVSEICDPLGTSLSVYCHM